MALTQANNHPGRMDIEHWKLLGGWNTIVTRMENINYPPVIKHGQWRIPKLIQFNPIYRSFIFPSFSHHFPLRRFQFPGSQGHHFPHGTARRRVAQRTPRGHAFHNWHRTMVDLPIRTMVSLTTATCELTGKMGKMHFLDIEKTMNWLVQRVKLGIIPFEKVGSTGIWCTFAGSKLPGPGTNGSCHSYPSSRVWKFVLIYLFPQKRWSRFIDNAINPIINLSFPIGSMYGIYANIGGILMVNVTIYSIHGSYGFGNGL